MAAKGKSKVRSQKANNRPARRGGVFLALTLVPLVIGGLLIVAWGLDIYLWEPPESQLSVGFLFILLSFAASNALQGLWYPAAGWALLGLSDLLILTWVSLPAQILAAVLALAGFGLIGVEFYRRWKEREQSKK